MIGKMKWANFLHIYQPAGQQPDILEAVTVQSYRPILEGIKKNKRARLTMNISGVLLEMFDTHGYRDLIELVRDLVNDGRLELTGSAKYHALLPFLSEEEITRQIQENEQTLQFYIGKNYRPEGFFPPEMAYDEKIIPIIKQFGYKWIIIDEIAYNGKTGHVDYSKTYKIKGIDLLVFFRERSPSNLIMGAAVRSLESLKEVFKGELNKNRYLLTGMDGETFGHHRPGLDKMLFEFFQSPELDLVKISDLHHFFPDTLEIEPVKSTWASSEEDIKKDIQFLSWDDPENEIHHWQKDLVNLALSSVYKMDNKNPGYEEVRKAMDEALSSDQFWWASGKPWWSLEEIVRGAVLCHSVIKSIPEINRDVSEKASFLYEKIISTAFQWKKSGKIYNLLNAKKNINRIPFKERTLEKGGEETAKYNAFIEMFKRLEKEASDNREYEKAILWRDAVWKIENKSDIYDAMHAIDLLRLNISNHEVEEIIEKYKQKYREIRGGQPEQRE
ncbi:MAG: hypothetical protein COV30_02410 [Candidatus Yanofskybacteria bacterium CG10_big_fil_rev_8_21_14_0_10_37_15]|uniref:Glycoside hydrolase family 57 N-terminal domain-containing protein n=1 Tax=Candidatus Yanofskybacteria bacterium CG10_big_fil_rev_8_21_14_0_10_37_15 TaxID=1975097 RepID=A0A2H0R567_9BACT|nr:MAG: hypothetical protein COV30_02410 [Candidatus Yanofskybacteria bacterium CG10_big_fil_rev_8_21_14_0_10_37_15]